MKTKIEIELADDVVEVIDREIQKLNLSLAARLSEAQLNYCRSKYIQGFVESYYRLHENKEVKTD